MTKEEAAKGSRVRIIAGGVTYVGREGTIVSDAPFSYGNYGMCVKIDFVDGTGEWIWTLGRLELIDKTDNKPLPLPG